MKNPLIQFCIGILLFLLVVVVIGVPTTYLLKRSNLKQLENIKKYEIEITYCDSRKIDTITTYSQHEITNNNISTSQVAVPQIELLVKIDTKTNKYLRFLNVCNIKTIKKYEN